MTTTPPTLNTADSARPAPRGRALIAGQLRDAARLPRPLLLTGATFLLLISAGLIAAARAALTPDPHHPVPLSGEALRSGETFHALEAHLDANLPGRDALIATANTARYLTVRGGTDEVRQGRDGWLFLTSELAAHPQAQRHLTARADLTARLSRDLAARGVTLLVAVSPNKTRVEAAHLPGGALPGWVDARQYETYQAMLRARGVATADLMTPMLRAVTRTPQYYRTDTHWNQDGARTAAQATAQAVRTLAADLPAATFTTTRAPETARPGDLLKLMGLQHVPDALRPHADREATETTLGGGGGLLGEAPQVMLAGSSYGLRGNYAGALQEALGSAVLNVSTEGAHFSGSIRPALQDPAFLDSPPRVLIWEIPQRFLPLPLDSEDQHPFKVP
ncbi:cell division protein FtsQ [Deinococcus seoulensis]|uniref:Cell division protein FtsQ n=1 Tax=Deinococcus seoulensis TaxID=1837379 RepID=A0ABQ2RV77_9DEIO|nr:cell division protein FtsQ [Deinococcus seoulensis]GGR58758.1 cell division protein FtsQ [Deinococcus seoulensis]